MLTPAPIQLEKRPIVEYQQKKAFLAGIISIYGRKPVLEALQDRSLTAYRLHLADSNKPNAQIKEMESIAKQRDIEVQYHNRQALSRISKNGKQDQGACLDILCPKMAGFEQWLTEQTENVAEFSIIALDGVSNPQNLGMAIRSCTAAGIDAILLPESGGSGLNPLVIKASTGTVFRAPIVRCESLPQSLQALSDKGLTVFTLRGDATDSLLSASAPTKGVFVLGNETDGVSKEVEALSTGGLRIPMKNGVESLNVAVSAALVAFHCGSGNTL